MTQFFLHDAASTNQSTKLPSSKQSSLTPINDTIISAATNKSMNTTAGTSEVSHSIGGTGSSTNWYCGRWVTDLCINQTSISADTWTFGNAASNDGSTSTFPVDSATSTKQYVCIYVWRPSTGAVVGTIFDGFTSTASNNPGSSETTSLTSVSGSAVSGIIRNDVLCVEWLAEGVRMSGTGSATIYYDGTDTTFGGGNHLSNIGSYISCTQTISLTAFSNTFTVGISDSMGTNPSETVKKVGKKNKSDTTQTVSESEKKLSKKKAITDTETVSETIVKTWDRGIKDAVAIATSSIAVYTQPLYAYPDWYDGPNYSWLQLVRVARENPHLQFIAVINPDSGPGTGLNSDFTHGISDLQSVSNIKILGYVFTDYGARAQADVEADIDSYATWYPSINGIMLDQMANTVTPTDYTSYYSAITAYAHGHSGVSFSLVIGNPGTSTVSNYVGTVDAITIYENNSYPSEATLQTNTFYPTYPRSNFSMTAYSVPSITATEINYTAKYCEYIFITDQADYFHNPTYADDEAQLMGTTSEVVTRLPKKKDSESVTVSESEKKKAIKKAIAETETVSETIKKKIIEPIADSLGAFSMAIARLPKKIHAETVSPVSEAEKKKAIKPLADTETVSESEKKKAIKPIHDITQSTSETLGKIHRFLRTQVEALKTKIVIGPR